MGDCGSGRSGWVREWMGGWDGWGNGCAGGCVGGEVGELGRRVEIGYISSENWQSESSINSDSSSD